MENVRPDFEEWGGTVDDIDSTYQEIRFHLIFYIKIGENFCRKSRFVAVGHTTDTPACLMYASVVTCNSVHIALTVVELNSGIPQIYLD